MAIADELASAAAADLAKAVADAEAAAKFVMTFVFDLTTLLYVPEIGLTEASV